MRHFSYSVWSKLFVISVWVVGLALVPAVQAASHYEVLYRFTGGADGAYPGPLIMDSDGNLYGTAVAGGDLACSNGYQNSGCGVVFELTPSGDGKWQEHVLYAFQGGTDGIGPSGNLVFDSSGNLYGTTGGGTDTNCNEPPGCGTVFQLSPNGDGTWTESVLYKFQDGPDGHSPNGVVSDASGDLYGVTYSEYAYEDDVFELSPPQQKGGSWTETTIYTTPYITWLSPYLVFGRNGNLYGSGTFAPYPGAVFELKHAGKNWQEMDLYNFLGGGNGASPQSGIIFDNRGNMYGTGAAGGNDWGIAFELKLVGGQWTQVMLHNFCRRNKCADGAWPYAPLAFDSAGNLYGTTYAGGAGCSSDRDGCGVVFKLSPAKRGKWTETVLHSFKGGLDGEFPSDGVTLDGKGHVYGTTPGGGTKSGSSYGIVFELTP